MPISYIPYLEVDALVTLALNHYYFQTGIRIKNDEVSYQFIQPRNNTLVCLELTYDGPNVNQHRFRVRIYVQAFTSNLYFDKFQLEEIIDGGLGLGDEARVTIAELPSALFPSLSKTSGIPVIEPPDDGGENPPPTPTAIIVTIHDATLISDGTPPPNPTAIVVTIHDATLVDDGGATPTSMIVTIHDATLIDDSLTALVVTIADAELEDIPDGAQGVVTPTSLNFGNVTIGDDPSTLTLTLSNEGNAPLTINEIAASGTGITQDNDCGDSLEAGGTCTINVHFAPEEAGNYSGSITFDTDSLDPIDDVPVTGTGIEEGEEPTGAYPQRISTIGNQFVLEDGTKIRLKSCNWFGAEGENHTPHGTWQLRYTDIIDHIYNMGFRCLRLPFSGDFGNVNLTVPGTAINLTQNPEFTGKTAYQILDLIIDYCATKEMYIVLDHHRRTSGNGADGSPTDGSYTQSSWINTWSVMANRYKDNLTVIGADVHNEPHDLTWTSWAPLVEACGNAIHQIAPHWIIFCEGVGSDGSDFYWWGGYLKGVATRPVSLNTPNKLAYSPHEYGQNVGNQTWLRYDSNPSIPANYPNNLYAVWHQYWGFIYEQNIAPIWIGEFGGQFGLDGNGNNTRPNGIYEAQWVTELCKYLNGDFNGDGNSDITGSDKGISFAYWSFNPNSGDTGGLVRDDWVTDQTPKLTLIAPLLTEPEPPASPSITDEDGNQILSEDGYVIVGEYA